MPNCNERVSDAPVDALADEESYREQLVRRTKFLQDSVKRPHATLDMKVHTSHKKGSQACSHGLSSTLFL